jgi:hypothetical protein
MLAVTVMKSGVCIAGVRREAPGTWVRPVREFGSVLLGDITYPSASGDTRRVMRPFDVVEFTLGRPHTEPPHVEDWTCEFARHRPRLVGVLPPADRADLLDSGACSPDAIWSQGIRSLGNLACTSLTATFRRDAYTGKYEARLAFAGLPPDMTSAACTDLKWRALGRRLLDDHAPARGDVRTLTLSGDELRRALGSAERCWLTLGTSRAYDGRYWPLVVGVHTLPDYEADVDYRAL